MWRFLKRWRNTILGLAVVLSGVSAAAITVVARRSGDWELARLGAIASLLFALLIIVFVVPPLARSARAEAARLDLPLQLTGGGAIFLGIYAVVTFAAWNTGNNLLFLVFSVLTSTIFVAWSAARASLRDLAVSARFPDHIFAGEAAPVIVTVHNRKRWLPSFSVVVEARSRDAEAEAARGRRARRPRKRVLAYFMYLPRRGRVEQRVEQTFERRGRVLVEGFEISTKFPFGFFRSRKRLRARDVEIVVYPKPLRASDELHLLPMEAGRTQAARRGAGHDLHSLREYQHRDDVRHIDWKATARQKRLFVREFTAEDERRVHVAFDTCLDGRAGPDALEAFERGVTTAASLVAHFIEERAEVRLTLGEEVGRYAAGREHLYDSLHRLALAAPGEPRPGRGPREEFWRRITPAADDPRAGYVILLTAAPPGSIPAHLWRKSHVIYL